MLGFCITGMAALMGMDGRTYRYHLPLIFEIAQN